MRAPRGALGLFLALAALGAAGCAPARQPLPQDAPDLARRIVLVVERPDYSPVAGAAVTIDAAPPARLVAPAAGRGVTDGRGALGLVFHIAPQYDQAVLAGGDVVAEYPVAAKLTIQAPGQPAMEADLSDLESYARFGGQAFEGLNRDPETGETYYTVVLDR